MGILLATYLLYNFIYRPAFQPCTINNTINCDAVIKGAVSTFLGVPVALIGLVGYVVILILAIYKKPKPALFMTAFGTLFCLRITFIEVFLIKVICPVCLACQLDMLAVFILAILLYKKLSITQVS